MIPPQNRHNASFIIHDIAHRAKVDFLSISRDTSILFHARHSRRQGLICNIFLVVLATAIHDPTLILWQSVLMSCNHVYLLSASHPSVTIFPFWIYVFHVLHSRTFCRLDYKRVLDGRKLWFRKYLEHPSRSSRIGCVDASVRSLREICDHIVFIHENLHSSIRTTDTVRKIIFARRKLHQEKWHGVLTFRTDQTRREVEHLYFQIHLCRQTKRKLKAGYVYCPCRTGRNEMLYRKIFLRTSYGTRETRPSVRGGGVLVISSVNFTGTTGKLLPMLGDTLSTSPEGMKDRRAIDQWI